MPKKVKGQHNLHVKVSEQNFRTLQDYCNGGMERISASAIIDLFMAQYIEHYLKPRMARGELASWTALQADLPSATALIANKIEPSAFPSPLAEATPND